MPVQHGAFEDITLDEAAHVDRRCQELAGALHDCSADGVPDACYGPYAFAAQSPAPSPFGAGFPATFTIPAHPGVLGAATLTLLCKADISAANENVVVRINGATIGTIYTGAQTDCVNPGSPATPTVPAPGLGPAGRDTGIAMVASSFVAPTWCGPSSFISVNVAYTAINPLDLDADGMIDSCRREDVDFDGVVDGVDPGVLLAARGAEDPLFDLDRNGAVDGPDVALLLGEWGTWDGDGGGVRRSR